MFWMFRKGSRDPFGVRLFREGAKLPGFSSLNPFLWTFLSLVGECGVTMNPICYQNRGSLLPNLTCGSFEMLENPPAPARLQESWTFDLDSTGSVPARRPLHAATIYLTPVRLPFNKVKQLGNLLGTRSNQLVGFVLFSDCLENI